MSAPSMPTAAAATEAAGRVAVHEVAPRDGLQMECRFVPTDDKVAWIDALSALGLAKIEVTSFTSPQAIPALRDAEAVMRRIHRAPGTVYAALVPNVRGAERAIEARTDELNLVLSASATHNLANLRMTQAQSWRALGEVIRLGQGSGVGINVSLSCAFGCPMEGDVDPSAVLGWVARFTDAGVTRVTLCDTTGMADPGQVLDLCSRVLARNAQLELTAHFHDTRGLAGANVMAALQAGVRRFDASLGGIGGCPYAPGASGNAATEDVVHLLHCLGWRTGVIFEGLEPAGDLLEQLLGHALPAAVRRAGPRWRRHPLPADFEATRARALAREATAAS
jgi:hydroxymethylglutaryl-CoA lyase